MAEHLRLASCCHARAQDALVEAARWSWSVQKTSCGEHGSGCRQCVQCCDGCFDRRPTEHLDFTAKREHGRETSLFFSWKPELSDEHDNASITHLCAQPPEMLILSKGLHEAAFRPFAHSSQKSVPIEELIGAYEESTASQIRRLGLLLRCLPVTTCIIWKTASLATRTPREAPLEALINRAARHELEVAQALGASSYVLDSFELTSRANTTGAVGIKSMDHHHYPDAVLHVEWALMLTACRLHAHLHASSEKTSKVRAWT